MNIENMIHVPTVEPGEKDYRGEDGLLRCGVCGEPKEAFFEGGFLLGGKDRHPVQCRCQREAKAKQEAEYREQQHRHTVFRLRQQGFQNPIMRKWTFDAAPIRTERLEQCRRYAERWDAVVSQNAGLLFWGDVGTGKSYLAACIANALIEKEVPVCMTNLAAVIDHDFEGRMEYIQKLCAYPLPLTGVRGFDQAQVTQGGIDCRDFDPATLGHRGLPGLYACGEILNVDGDCGGYNLQFAFATGLLAGGEA